MKIIFALIMIFSVQAFATQNIPENKKSCILTFEESDSIVVSFSCDGEQPVVIEEFPYTQNLQAQIAEQILKLSRAGYKIYKVRYFTTSSGVDLADLYLVHP